jgi:hypothetical protein
VSVQTNLLPPGTAYVSAFYGGDATHATSTATPVKLTTAVAGAGYGTSVQLNFVTFDSNNNPVPTTQSQTVAYGSPYILNILAKKSGNSSTCGFNYPATLPSLPCPTGKITLTDGGSPLNDFPNGPNGTTNQPGVSNQGLVEDALVQLTGGKHTILAAYAGDANYAAGSSNTLSVTITPAQTTTLVASNLGSISSGTSVVLTAIVGSTSNSVQGPTGTVQFQNGGANIGSPVTCTPSAATANAGASCSAQLTTTISALYPPPTGRGPQVPMLPVLFALLSLVLFVLGWGWIPENRRRAYAYAGFLVFALMSVGIAGCGGGGGSSGGGGKTVTINAAYAGDTNYSSSSGSTTINVQ